MTVTCQECGKKLDNWSVKHTFEDCAKHHLVRACQMMGYEKAKNLLSIANLRGDCQ